MTRVGSLTVQEVRTIPSGLADGVLYVSREFDTAAHRCGCGREVVTPLGPTDWKLSGTGPAPSMGPSIGNWSFPCRSHYIIRNGQVVWADSWSMAQIAKGRAADMRRKDAFFAERQASPVKPRRGWFERLVGWFRGR
jgi:hypothetical protein